MNRSEYLASVRERYKKNGGKLFLADPDRGSAAEAVLPLIPADGTALVVAPDKETAREYAVLLGEGCETVCSAEDMRALAGEKKSAGEYRRGARPPRRLVVAAEGGELLHAPLCTNELTGGIYYFGGTDGRADYCFSDYLADCRFDFVLIDGAYSLLSLQKRQEGVQYTPVGYDRLSLFGREYFSERAHSHRRLWALAGSAKGCVVLSDVPLFRDAAYLYAVLFMLHGSYSYHAARDFVREHSSDYTEACELAYNCVYNCRSEESVMDECLRYTHDFRQRVPKDTRSIEEEIGATLEYLSEEETALFSVAAYARAEGIGRVEDAIERIDGNIMEMARFSAETFFGEPLRAEFEGTLTEPWIASMGEKDAEALMRIFSRYGLVRAGEPAPSRCRVLRTVREDSAFEYLVRGGNTEGDFCAIGRGERLEYRCLFAAKEGASSAPCLFLAQEEDHDAILPLLKKFGAEGVLCGTDAAAQGKSALLDFRRYLACPRPISAKKVILFGFPAALNALSAILDRAVREGGEVRILTDYEDMSGILADMWEREILQEGGVPCPEELSLKEGYTYDYAEILGDLNCFYTLLGRTAEGEDNAADGAERFNGLLARYTSHTALPEAGIKEDFGYLSSLAHELGALFSNAVSAGGKGEVTDGTQSLPWQFFNVCSRYLLRKCDTRQKDCADCPLYDRLRVNDFDLFRASLRAFYEKSAAYFEEAEQRRLRALDEKKINSGEEDGAAFGKLAALARRRGEDAEGILKKLALKKTKMFHVPHWQVRALLEGACDLYDEILKKYAGELLGVFLRATELLVPKRQAAKKTLAAIRS